MSCVRRAQPCTNPILPANDGKRELGRGVVKIVDARRVALRFLVYQCSVIETQSVLWSYAPMNQKSS